MDRFVVKDTFIRSVKVVYQQPIADHRGSLARVFCMQELASIGWHKPVAQINRSFTKERGSVRGMHYQINPHAEMKLVSCLRGTVFDVVVDLRAGSPSLLEWHAEELSEADQKIVFVPEGVAHGFQALTNEVELLYIHSAAYQYSAEARVHPLDPRIAIDWKEKVLNLSLKDDAQAMLDPDFAGIQL